MAMTDTKSQFPDNVTVEQAQGQIAQLPAQMVYDARWAIQQVRDTPGLSVEKAGEIVEPLSRALGWAEALVFAFDKTTERDIVTRLFGNSPQ